MNKTSVEIARVMSHDLGQYLLTKAKFNGGNGSVESTSDELRGFYAGYACALTEAGCDEKTIGDALDISVKEFKEEVINKSLQVSPYTK